MLKFGTTTCEVKSGYGLSFEDEIKCLEIIKELDEEQPVDIIPTFLGAHTVPPEYKNKRAKYLKLLTEVLIPTIAERNLAKFCDVFCEKGAFNISETRKILQRAMQYGLIPKLHTEEFSAMGGVQLAVELKAMSADHLVKINKQGISRLKESNVTAVLLPGTSFFLGISYAPARKLIREGIPVALGSDFNPGSCPTFSLQIIMTIASTQMKMTPEEALTATTINSAYSLGIDDKKGQLAPGKTADIVIWRLPNYKQIPYFFGINNVSMVIKDGKEVLSSSQ